MGEPKVVHDVMLSFKDSSDGWNVSPRALWTL